MKTTKTAKIILLLIIWVITIGATIFFTKYIENRQNKPVTYTDKEVKDNTFIYLSDYHKSYFNYWDSSSGFDQGFYNLEVYVESDITATACVTIDQYNDDVMVHEERLSFNLLEGATVVRSSLKLEPAILVYNGETFEEANLTWEVTDIISGECQ